MVLLQLIFINCQLMFLYYRPTVWFMITVRFVIDWIEITSWGTFLEYMPVMSILKLNSVSGSTVKPRHETYRTFIR